MMNSSRRDLLRRFGIGAIIAPIIGGSVDTTAAAELIEVPKVRAVEIFSKIPDSIDLSKVRRAKVAFEMEDGSVRVVNVPHARFESAFPPTYDLTVHGQRSVRTYVPGLRESPALPVLDAGDMLTASVSFSRLKAGVSPGIIDEIGSIDGFAELL